MDRLKSLWWQEEVDEKYEILKRFNYSRFFLVLIFWAVIWILQSTTQIRWLRLEWIHFIYAIAQLAACFLIKVLDKRGEHCKSVFAILLAECNCLGWWALGTYKYKSSRILFSNLSLVCIKVCEWPFIQTSWLRIFIICKHLVMWYYMSYFNGELDFSADTVPHLIGFLTIFLCNIYCQQGKKNSLERFLSRKNLENAEKRLSVLFNLFPDGLLILSNLKSILYSNVILTRLLSCDIDEIVQKISEIEYCQNKKYSNLSKSNRLIDDIDLIHKLQLNQQVVLGLSQSGDLNLEWRAQKVLWDEGQEAILLTVKDANHIIQLEQTLGDNRLKNVLLRSVSHELRTPINAITSLSDSLISEKEILCNEKISSKLNVISVSSKLLLSLVNDLLDYSRILAGAFSIQKSKFCLRSAVNDAVQLIKLQADKKNLKIIVRIDPQIPDYIYSDRLRFSQILLNLLSNALKFTLSGYIDICCLLSSEGKLHLTIKDTGIGIESSKLFNIFKEFNTVNNPILNPSGCGLGLFISNIIAKELGNEKFEAQSDLGKGSCFGFSIDIYESKTLVESREYEEFEISSEDILPVQIKNFSEIIKKQYPQVLIVDDNEFNRIALGALLSHYEVLFEESCTGMQAVKKVKEVSQKKKPFKLVIMDGSMPELNGWDATKIIHQLYYEGQIESLPSIIGYTAFGSDADVSLCINSGMKECLIKPCSPEILMEKISKYLYM
ncbi:unnamed protein product [Blepharisma stoltei]|uniref:Histidine kinase n=1 Tax=Blepharisma stoltei TaxID=1481888 RepID=A0AAU9KCX7_9CILI|nr:unnamed protein product [Blepharisma stoltei]